MVTSNRESGTFDAAATMDGAERSRKWIVMQNDECVGVYESRKDALAAALRRFGRVPMITTSVDNQPTIMRPMFRELPEDFPTFVSAHSNAE
ncbi:MAG: hypothetical protein J4G14_10705 [Dehalococcoidia bacterium]|nr:hypothetical protein [Dehalococcoidia bacterium]